MKLFIFRPAVAFLLALLFVVSCSSDDNAESIDGDTDSLDVPEQQEESEDSETAPDLSITVEDERQENGRTVYALKVANNGDATARDVKVIPSSASALGFDGAYSESTVIESYEGDNGKARLEERNGLRIAYLEGTHYEMGYQQGVLLGDALLPVFNGIVATAAMQMGLGSMDMGLGWLRELKDYMEPYTPAKYIEEMQGIADGAASVGCPLDMEDIFLLNIIIDAPLYLYKLAPKEGMDATIPYDLEHGPDCSSFAVWGEASEHARHFSAAIQEYTPYRIDAFGGNETTEKYRGLLIVGRPDEGYDFLLPTVPGMIGVAQGLNSAGVGTSSKGSNSFNSTMCGCGISFESREIVQYAGSIEDALEFMSGPHNRARGHNRQIDDANAGKSVIIETSASELSLRGPGENEKIIATNHFRCWPGFEGCETENHNIVEGQFMLGYHGFGIEDIPDRESWEALMEEETPRYKFYEEQLKLISEMNASTAMNLLSRNRGEGHYSAAEWEEVFSDVDLYKSDETGDITSTGELGPSHRSVMFPAERSAWVSWGLEDLNTLGPWIFVNLEIPPEGYAIFEIGAKSETSLDNIEIEFEAISEEGASAKTSVEATFAL